MLELGLGEELSVAPVNAGLLALWAALPGLCLAYGRQTLAARRIRPEFSLRRSEAIELDRALLLYEKACCRLKEIEDQDGRAKGWRRTLFDRRIALPQHDADEIEDLQAHAEHLRGTIVRLKRQPLQRLRCWVRILSWQYALGGALAAHVLAFALLMVATVALHASWADELTAGMKNPVTWYPLDERLFYANAIAAAFAAVTALMFFLIRRVTLRGNYALELCALKEFATADLGQIVDQPNAGDADREQSPPKDASEADQHDSWFAVLGLTHSATIEQVKDAYKTLIKQNHPDRVNGMSPAFTKLAETETKKLNAAYRRALFSLLPLESRKCKAAD
jgi:DnaJ domain